MPDKTDNKQDIKLDDLIKSIDTKEPEEMRQIWEGFSLDVNKQKKENDKD